MLWVVARHTVLSRVRTILIDAFDVSGVLFYIANWQISVMVKYLILSTSSFIVIVLLYDLLIRRIKGLAFVFGLQFKK